MPMFDLKFPPKFSRSRYFTPTKVTYSGKKKGTLASPLVLVEGGIGDGYVVRFRLDLQKKMMVDHPERQKVRRACKRLVQKIVTHTVTSITAK